MYDDVTCSSAFQPLAEEGLHAYTCIHMHPHAYTCMHMHTHACTCMHMHAHAYACIHMHTHAYTCMHMHTHAYACIHMLTHAYASETQTLVARLGGIALLLTAMEEHKVAPYPKPKP